MTQNHMIQIHNFAQDERSLRNVEVKDGHLTKVAVDIEGRNYIETCLFLGRHGSKAGKNLQQSKTCGNELKSRSRGVRIRTISNRFSKSGRISQAQV